MADHGIVIGIDTYPGLGTLEGPCNDATAFYEWLTDPEKGGVDPNNVTKLLSSDFPPPDVNDLQTAHPHVDEVLEPFFQFVDMVQNDEHENGRLFVYVAGHGFADTQDMDSAALYTANAATNRPLHLAITKCTDWLRRNWAFDEVILIMDTCRTTNPMHEISNPMLPRTDGHKRAERVKRFHGFAAGWKAESREKDFDGHVRGIFSMALMEALENAKPNRLGRVTGTVVEDYIHNVIDDLAGDTEIGSPHIYAKKRKDVCFLKRNTNTIEVPFHIAPGLLGRELVILNDDLSISRRITLDEPEFTEELNSGKFFTCSIVGANDFHSFQVTNDAEVRLQ